MTELSDLTTLIGRCTGAQVLCIGDLMLDRFVDGTVERISPEAPIPVLRKRHEAAMLGGVGNVVRNLSAIGASSTVVAVVGTDGPGEQVAALLAAEPGVTARLERLAARPTTVKTRFLSGGHQLLRVDDETTAALAAEAEARLAAACAQALPGCGAVALSDYGKGVLTPRLIAAVMEAAAQAGVPVIVDPKGRDFARYRGAALLTPNRAELAHATGLPTRTDEEVVAAARRVLAECGVAAVLVTRSEDGMTLVTAAGEVEHIQAQAREVFDVSGAGDTVVALLSAAIAAGAPAAAAARLANLGGGIVVGKVGTAVVRPDELMQALVDRQAHEGSGKLMTLPETVDRVERWRRAGLRVGFTNGCFDLLHPGHISLLEQARRACDRLVVGLNSDASVGRLKGPERPVQHEVARATVLASLASVDAVVVFDEDTPLELIRTLRPDVLVKGSDYTVEQVVGADVVQGYGGRVMLAELVPQQSTTRLVARMRRQPGAVGG
ncbi:D-glycero-beta-D-manno-heptose-7-phosphate kinase [Arenibaculum pallidiluteum]|uniref:D-glycero-beta-D-manno-heptose-7-phosphate kinase n=1 Tax=Arenibaculum pallidiluteum TaxID=2812559 RepID=UPI001A96F6E0|nr:D-glycero-beta-D-manno-heptose-7-phosphate kinase [Arenibaculum pallidiluteum]